MFLYVFAQKERLQCKTCGRFYNVHTRRTRMFRNLLIAVWVLTIAGLLILILD